MIIKYDDNVGVCIPVSGIFASQNEEPCADITEMSLRSQTSLRPCREGKHSDGRQYWHWSNRITQPSLYPAGLTFIHKHSAKSLPPPRLVLQWRLRRHREDHCLMPHKTMTSPCHRRGGHTQFDELIVWSIFNQCLLNYKFPCTSCQCRVNAVESRRRRHNR